jgi:uncharacterized repeat protein (TIGR01451 family)
LGWNVLKKYVFRWIVGMILTTISLAAFATTATFSGKYRSYPAGTHYFEVRVGETIDIEGHCAIGSFWGKSESFYYTEWTVGADVTNDEAKAPNNFAGDQRHPFVVSGPPGRKFGVKMQCFTNSTGYTNDSVSRQFTVLDPSPPSVAWRNSNAKYANGKITISADVTGTGDGVKDVYILWAGAPRHDLQMTHIAGNQYQYEIDASNLSEGKKDVQIWASSKSGDNNGWQSVGSFIVDHSKPVIDWDYRNQKYAKTSITIDANISDTASGVSDVWIWWTGARSTSIQMPNVGGDHYRHTIDTSRLPDGVAEVQIWARDKVGNETNWQVKGRFTVDHLAPKIEWDATNAPFLNAANDGITIKATISDAASGVDNVRIWWTGAPNTNIKMKNRSGNQYDYRIDSLPDGVKDVQIWATDNLGNSTGWVSKGSFIVDTTPPVINWLEPLDQAVLSNGQIHIAGNIVDDYPDYVVIEWQQENDLTWRSHTMSIDRANRGDFQYDLSNLTRGVNTLLRLHAADKAGNVSANTPQRTVIRQARDDDQLRLEKTVDKKNALPGETLRYTITFTNISTEDLSEIVIKDTIQSAYLTLRRAQCGRSMPHGLRCCVSSEKGGQCGNANVVARKPGALEWRFNGVLEAGESGSVNYEAQVNTK